MILRIKIWLLKTVLAPIVGWALHQANCRPPVASRTEFYALKVRLCEQFGWWERAELQHVVKKCWECGGRGWNEYEYFETVSRRFLKTRSNCQFCARGVYREFWVRLEKWKVGGFVFHQPTIRYDSKIEWNGGQIEGLIEHARPKWNLYSECWLWLGLIFDRKSFWRDFTGTRRKGFLPLISLQRLIWDCRRWRETRIGQRICKRFKLDDGIPF